MDFNIRHILFATAVVAIALSIFKAWGIATLLFLVFGGAPFITNQVIGSLRRGAKENRFAIVLALLAVGAAAFVAAGSLLMAEWLGAMSAFVTSLMSLISLWVPQVLVMLIYQEEVGARRRRKNRRNSFPETLDLPRRTEKQDK